MNVNEMLSCVVAAVLFMAVAFVLYYDLWRDEGPADKEPVREEPRGDGENERNSEDHL